MEDKLYKYGVFSKSRVETFSDGIFAIIVTLLILEIKVPHVAQVNSVPDLFNAVVALIPKFASWVISFITICIVWVNHHRIFEMFKGINIVLFWLNVNLLLWVCFVPFPTALAGDYPGNPLAVAFYGLVMALIGLAFFFIRLYGLKNKELLKETVVLKVYKHGVISALLFGFTLYGIAAALAWVNTYLSLAMYFFIAIYFVFSFAIHKSD